MRRSCRSNYGEPSPCFGVMSRPSRNPVLVSPVSDVVREHAGPTRSTAGHDIVLRPTDCPVICQSRSQFGLRGEWDRLACQTYSHRSSAEVADLRLFRPSSRQGDKDVDVQEGDHRGLYAADSSAVDILNFQDGSTARLERRHAAFEPARTRDPAERARWTQQLQPACLAREGWRARPAFVRLIDSELRRARARTFAWLANRSSRAVGKRERRMARPAGFEPATLGSGGRYSIQLSYGRIVVTCRVVFRRPGWPEDRRSRPNRQIRDRSDGLPAAARRALDSSHASDDWCARRDLNPRPTGSKPGALSS